MIRHDPLDDMPTAWEAYGSRFDDFVENVANGKPIADSGVPLWAARVFWQRVISDLGPQAV